MSALRRESSISSCAISIENFENGTIDPDLFDHEAHVYIAWSYLQRNDLMESIKRFCEALKRLTRKLGIESKYHETLSWFFMVLIAERQAGLKDWPTFKRRNADIFATQPSIFRAYYSNERLGSEIARNQFVLPDRPSVP